MENDFVQFDRAMIGKALEALRQHKPNDRSEKDRRYQIAITDLEKVFAYFQTMIVQGWDVSQEVKQEAK